MDEQLKEYIAEWRKQRVKEEEELKRLKEKQAKRKVLREEEDKRLAQMKKEEEDRLRREIEEKKQRDMEEKRRRLAEVEQKRQVADKASKVRRILLSYDAIRWGHVSKGPFPSRTRLPLPPTSRWAPRRKVPPAAAPWTSSPTWSLPVTICSSPRSSWKKRRRFPSPSASSPWKLTDWVMNYNPDQF